MSAKLVEAAGAPWSPLDEEFHDPDVAVDFLSSLDPRLGPTVVKVGDPTGREPSKERLVGWWLCESGKTGRLMRNVRSLYLGGNLRPLKADGYRGPLDEWRDARDAAAAIAWASAVGVPRKKLASAALDAALDAMRLSAGGRSPNRSIESAIRGTSSVLSGLLAGKDVAEDASYRRDAILTSVIADSRLTNGEMDAMRAQMTPDELAELEADELAELKALEERAPWAPKKVFKAPPQKESTPPKRVFQAPTQRKR